MRVKVTVPWWVFAALTITVPYVYAWLRGYHSWGLFLSIGTARLVAACMTSLGLLIAVYLLLLVVRSRGKPSFGKAFWFISLIVVSAWALISSTEPPFALYG